MATEEEGSPSDEVQVRPRLSLKSWASSPSGRRSGEVQRKTIRQFHASGVVNAEEELAFYENLHKIRKTFLENDLNNDGVITAEELELISKKLGGEVVSYDIKMFERVIDELKLVAKKKGIIDERLDEEGIPFEIFAQILYSEDSDGEVDFDLRDSIRVLRNFFRDCGNARILEEAADVKMWEIDELEKSVGERILRIIDPIIGLIIMSNVVLIGISIDHDNPPSLEIFEYVFVVCYVLEVAFKIWHFGPPSFFLGTDWSWHWFDILLALMGIVDAIGGLAGMDTDLGPFMYLRLLRVARLVRLVRLMRAFKDLSIMVTGLLAGLRTMMWVMLILAMVIYSLAVVLTAVVGRDETSTMPYREELFSTVTRSMFTMFVCLTDGCTNYDGTPISHQLFSIYGTPFFISYCLAMVVVTFGLFNLIMAIFVENTMEVEEAMKQNEGLRPYLAMFSGAERRATSVKDSILSMACGDDEFKLTRAQFDSILGTKAVQSLLDELEIDELDRKGLFEVLDSDSSGTLTIEELVSGLMAVRGQAKKSDTVGTMLAVKSVQKSLRTTAALLLQNHHWVDERLQALEQREEEARAEMTRRLDSLEKSMWAMMQGRCSSPQSTGCLSSQGSLSCWPSPPSGVLSSQPVPRNGGDQMDPSI